MADALTLQRRNGAFRTKFDFGDGVHIDEDKSIRAIVTSFCWTPMSLTVQACWFHNGTQQSAWFEEWRLSPCEKTAEAMQEDHR